MAQRTIPIHICRAAELLECFDEKVWLTDKSMKSRRLSFFALLIVLLLVAWWFLKSKGVSPVEPPVRSVPVRSPNSTVPNGTTSQPGPSHPKSMTQPASNPVDPKVAQIEAIVAAENSRSLDFYGIVIDQHGDPVAGVKVKAGVGLIVSFSHSDGKDYFTETDTSGRFSFVGIHGAGVGFLFTKAGYSYDQRQPASSRPNDYVPEPNNPVVFAMWKLKGSEPMVKTRIHAYIPCDGTPTMFDLLTGKKVLSGGDLTVRLTRDPVQIVRGNPFGWQLSLEISEGGLQEITDLYPNEAPAVGYQQIVTVSMPVGAKNWSADCKDTYYFTAENGHDYGRINIDLTGDFQPPPTSFDADIYINPSGSRNLEFDPAKAIKQKR